MREILLKPELYKFRTFGELGGTFCLGKRDLIFTTEALYEAFVKPYTRNVSFLRQDIRDGEPTEDMIEEIFAGLDYDSYDRVIAIGVGTIMDIGKLLCVRRTGTVNELFFKRAELIREKQLIAVPTTCGTGSEVTSTSVAIVKDEDDKYQRCQFRMLQNTASGLYEGHLDQKEELKGNAAMIEDAEYTVIDKLNGFLYFSIGNKLYTYRKGIDECVEVNLQGVNFDPIVSLNVIAHNDYKANVFVATYSETNKGKVYRLTPESTDSRNLTVEEVIDTEGAVKCITYW